MYSLLEILACLSDVLPNMLGNDRRELPLLVERKYNPYKQEPWRMTSLAEASQSLISTGRESESEVKCGYVPFVHQEPHAETDGLDQN